MNALIFNLLLLAAPAAADVTNHNATLLCFKDQPTQIPAGKTVLFKRHAAVYDLDPTLRPEALALAERAAREGFPLFVSVQVAGQTVVRLATTPDPRCDGVRR